MVRYKPSERLPKDQHVVVIYYRNAWYEASYDKEANNFTAHDYADYIDANEIEWWCNPLEEEAIAGEGFMAWNISGKYGKAFWTQKDDCILDLLDSYEVPNEKETVEEFWDSEEGKGWKIRPVKLVFLDHENANSRKEESKGDNI